MGIDRDCRLLLDGFPALCPNHPDPRRGGGQWETASRCHHPCVQGRWTDASLWAHGPGWTRRDDDAGIGGHAESLIAWFSRSLLCSSLSESVSCPARDGSALHPGGRRDRS